MFYNSVGGPCHGDELCTLVKISLQNCYLKNF